MKRVLVGTLIKGITLYKEPMAKHLPVRYGRP
jgi:hypothetical protein